MRPSCLDAPSSRRLHTHRLTVDGKFQTADQCLSKLLWGQVARGIMLDQRVRMDGQNVRWDKLDAYAYLATMAASWRRGISAPQVQQ